MSPSVRLYINDYEQRDLQVIKNKNKKEQINIVLATHQYSTLLLTKTRFMDDDSLRADHTSSTLFPSSK